MAIHNKSGNHTPSPPADNKSRLFIYCTIFIVGFLAGVAFTVYKGSSFIHQDVTAGKGQTPPHNEEIHQAINSMEAEVTANPGNHQAWTRLGNLYYDTDQADKAIAAYNKSLALHKGDANLLTDLGVMYRKVKNPEKAIELFNQAGQEDPGHLSSRYNKGIVLLYDLNDPQGAVASWEDMLKIDPEAKSSNGMSIRDLIEKIKGEQAAAR